MDPLHPLPPIQPLAPAVPDSPARIQRIEREQQRESPPNRERPPQRDDGDEREFDDSYEPDWDAWKTVEAVEEAGLDEFEPRSERRDAWDAGGSGDRRTVDDAAEVEDDEDRPGPHIDISA